MNRRIVPGDGDPRHGTSNGYSNLMCRCQPCRDAWAKSHQAYLDRHPEQRDLARAREAARRRAAGSKPVRIADRARVRELAEAGLTRQEIARDMGFAVRTVADIVRELGITLPRSSQKLSAQVVADCAAAGLTQAEAAQKLDVNRGTVSRAAVRYGITFASPVRRGRPPLISAPDLQRCADDGLTALEASERLGCSRQSVYAAVRRYGIELTPGKRGRPRKVPS